MTAAGTASIPPGLANRKLDSAIGFAGRCAAVSRSDGVNQARLASSAASTTIAMAMTAYTRTSRIRSIRDGTGLFIVRLSRRGDAAGLDGAVQKTIRKPAPLPEPLPEW